MLYTQSEVYRTAFKYIEGTTTNASSVGFGLKHGVNEVCICCKTPAEPLSESELTPFRSFYTAFEYKAYKCPSCGYMFSWYKKR